VSAGSGARPSTGPVWALVLAAGGSQRLGRPKQLLTWRGETLVRRAARAALGSGCDGVAVVLGAEEDAVREALAGLPVRVARNPGWEEGLASSIRAGVALARAEGAWAVLLTLADQPLVGAELLGRLVAAHRRGHSRVACRYAGGLGVPALLGGPGDLAALGQLRGDRGARALLRDATPPPLAIPFEDAALDIDDDASWEAARAELRRRAARDPGRE